MDYIVPCLYISCGMFYGRVTNAYISHRGIVKAAKRLFFFPVLIENLAIGDHKLHVSWRHGLVPLKGEERAHSVQRRQVGGM